MPAHGFTISVVIPVYGCADCLDALYGRLSKTLGEIGCNYEVIFVDDRSPDGAWEKILELQKQHAELKALRLSRNFGQQMAIHAGLSSTKGDFAVVMDCDLQDPPERIHDLLQKIREGFDFVLARRALRSHSAFRIFSATLYFKLLGLISEKKIDGDYGSFSLLSRPVINAFLTFREPELHYLFVLRWLGFRAGAIEYTQDVRATGHSSYTLGGLLRHALNGILFQGTVFLRWIVIIGFSIALLGIVLSGYFVYQYVTRGSVPGWTSVVVLLLLCTGAILASLGVIGLYVAKVFEQGRQRPMYVIDLVSDRSSKW